MPVRLDGRSPTQTFAWSRSTRSRRRARRFDFRSTTGRHPRAALDALLERFVAGLVVIGVLVWGASILATPSDPVGAPDEAPDTPAPTEDPREPLLVDDDSGDDEKDDRDDEDRDRKRKGKRDREG